MGNTKLHNSVEQQDSSPDIVYTLNTFEQNTLLALIAYTAYAHGSDRDMLEVLFLEKFQATSIRKMERTDFDEAIRYLVDLIPEEFIN